MTKEFSQVDRKLKMLSEHYRIAGQPFSIEGREWQYEYLFVPWEDTAFKLWPRNPDTFDKSLMGKVGMVVEWTPELVTELAEYEAKHPGQGLRLVPIMLIVHCLERGSGKTVGVAGCAIASMAMDEGVSISFNAAAMKQSTTLIQENYLEPIEGSSKLAKAFDHTGNKLTFHRKGQNRSSFMEFVETSHSSITGRRRNRIVIDEARDVEGRTFTALLPSIKARARLRCKHGHCNVTYVEDRLEVCPTCKDFLYPWIPKVVVSSSAGLIEDGSEKVWFMELVQSLQSEPNGFTVLFDGTDVNPASAKVESEMMETVFGKVSSIKTYLDIELNNVARRKGQDFLSVAEVKQCVAPNLTHVDSSEDVCVGFLDASRTGDLTSLVIVSNDTERDTLPGAKPDGFRYIKLAHIKYWDPKDPRQCPRGIIERKDVEQHLADVLWKFPNLVDIFVDTRGSLAWVVDMMMDIRANRVIELRHAKGKLKPMVKLQGQERNIAWGQLENRIKTQTLRLFNHKLLLEEFKAVRRVETLNGEVEIRDRNRKKRHADLLEGLTQCCYRIHKYQLTPRASFGEANTSTSVQRSLRTVFGDPRQGLRTTALDVKLEDL